MKNHESPNYQHFLTVYIGKFVVNPMFKFRLFNKKKKTTCFVKQNLQNFENF